MRSRTCWDIPIVYGGTRCDFTRFGQVMTPPLNPAEAGKCSFCPGNEREVRSRLFFDADGNIVAKNNYNFGAEDKLTMPSDWAAHVFYNKSTPWPEDQSREFHGCIVLPSHDDPVATGRLHSLFSLIGEVEQEYFPGRDCKIMFHWLRAAGQNMYHPHIHIVACDGFNPIPRTIYFDERQVCHDEWRRLEARLQADGVYSGDVFIFPLYPRFTFCAKVITYIVGLMREKYIPRENLIYNFVVEHRPSQEQTVAIVHPYLYYTGGSEVAAANGCGPWSLPVPHETIAGYLSGKLNEQSEPIS